MKTTITKEAKGYIFNQETKQLESYELISIRFKFTEENKTYKCLVAGVEKEIVTPFLRVYKTKEDFERENYSDLFIVNFKIVNEDGYSLCREDTNGDYYSWEYVNGEAVYQKLNDLEFIYENSRLDYFDKSRKFYITKEDLYKHHNYTIIESDGTQKEVVCLAKKLELTKVQQLLVDEYEDLMSRMKNANLTAVIDHDGNHTYFINRENIKELDWYNECESSVSIIEFAERIDCYQIVHNMYDYDISAIMKD